MKSVPFLWTINKIQWKQHHLGAIHSILFNTCSPCIIYFSWTFYMRPVRQESIRSRWARVGGEVSPQAHLTTRFVTSDEGIAVLLVMPLAAGASEWPGPQLLPGSLKAVPCIRVDENEKQVSTCHRATGRRWGWRTLGDFQKWRKHPCSWMQPYKAKGKVRWQAWEKDPKIVQCNSFRWRELLFSLKHSIKMRKQTNTPNSHPWKMFWIEHSITSKKKKSAFILARCSFQIFFRCGICSLKNKTGSWKLSLAYTTLQIFWVLTVPKRVCVYIYIYNI